MRIAKYLTVIVFFILVFDSCRKDSFITDSGSKLELRQDTLWFDTVFTNANARWPKSVNKQIIIVNPHAQKIKTSIHLAGGPQSHFRMNVDGVPGTNFTDLEIFPEDSLFIFVEVHPDANNNSPDFNPLIIRDSVLFSTNGNEQKVNLIGWGQDAHYIFRDSIETDTSWQDTNLPIVIYGYCYVKPDVKLSIEKGMKIHYAPGSWLFVEGELEVDGTVDQPVVMQGDRLQPDWEEIPGQWGGIWLAYPSKGNYLKHALIKNGTVGVFCDTLSGDNNQTPNVTIDRCHIRNMSFDGVAGRYAKIDMLNSLSVNCGRFTFLASFGGEYDIRHCTFHTGSQNFIRRDPTLAILNINRNALGQVLSEHEIDFYMANSIVDGSNQEGEIGTDINPSMANLLLEHNLIRSTNAAYDVNNNVLNRDTIFTDPRKYDYSLDSLSAAKDIGKLLTPNISIDKNDEPRNNPPDAGAYESKY